MVQVLVAAVWKEQSSESWNKTNLFDKLYLWNFDPPHVQDSDVNISTKTRRTYLPLHFLTLFLLASLGADWPIRNSLSQTAQPIMARARRGRVMGDVMEVAVCDCTEEDGWDNHDNNGNQSENERQTELKPDWFKMKWREELGIVMSQFHKGVKKGSIVRLTDDITAGGGCGFMRSGDRTPPTLTPPFSPKFNHLPLMGTLHRER